MTDEARNLLAQKGIVPPNLFNLDIRKSWVRCFESGLDPFDDPTPKLIREKMIQELRGQSQLVRRLALIEMQNLHRQIAGSNFIIIFANQNGIILDSMSEDVSLSAYANNGVAPGYIWSEDINGTNALGLVVTSGGPSIVHGEEHYFKKYSNLTCAAAPVFGPDDEIVGILDASSDCRSRQRHTLALVKMSCLTIENSLFRDRHWDKLIIELHNRFEFLGTLQSGLLAFEEDGFLVETNRQARSLLQGIPLQPKVHFNEIFHSPFNEFLNRLYRSLLVQITDVKSSSFAAKAFNFYPRKCQSVMTKSAPSPTASGELRMIHDDPVVKHAVKMVERAAQLGAPILIRGETGTGKELLARCAHITSGRSGDFVAVNCAALPDTLIESELFGYKEGAFTGASREGSIGLVQQADGGTLFLDEIGAMPVQFQAKLLRFLDGGQVRPIGSNAELQVNIQLVSATNSNLSEAVESGEFRADLFYRINAMEVILPPLRERADFCLLVETILDDFDNPPHLEIEALQMLEAYHWPGNVRELKSFLTRILIGVKKEIVREEHVRDLLRTFASNVTRKSERKNLADQEREIVLAAYKRHKGNISAVARELGISRNKVYKKLKEIRYHRNRRL